MKKDVEKIFLKIYFYESKQVQAQGEGAEGEGETFKPTPYWVQNTMWGSILQP